MWQQFSGQTGGMLFSHKVHILMSPVSPGVQLGLQY